MQKIFTYITFITFLALCAKGLYENNYSLLSSDESSIIAVRSISEEQKEQNQGTKTPEAKLEPEKVEEEVDYSNIVIDTY